MICWETTGSFSIIEESELISLITRFATQELKPDLTIYLDLEVEEGLRRKSAANVAGQGEWNRMDRLELAFHRRVRDGYLEMAAAEPDRWLVMDATASVEEINRVICHRLEQLLKELATTQPTEQN